MHQLYEIFITCINVKTDQSISKKLFIQKSAYVSAKDLKVMHKGK